MLCAFDLSVSQCSLSSGFVQRFTQLVWGIHHESVLLRMGEQATLPSPRPDRAMGPTDELWGA